MTAALADTLTVSLSEILNQNNPAKQILDFWP